MKQVFTLEVGAAYALLAVAAGVGGVFGFAFGVAVAEWWETPPPQVIKYESSQCERQLKEQTDGLLKMIDRARKEGL